MALFYQNISLKKAFIASHDRLSAFFIVSRANGRVAAHELYRRNAYGAILIE